MSDSSTTQQDDFTRFVSELYSLNTRAHKGLSDARGALARLRRALGQTLNYSVIRDLAPALPEQGLSDQDLDNYLLVAGLFALYQPPSQGRPPSISFGGTLKALRAHKPFASESLDQRMTAVLEARKEDLPYRLRQIVHLLKGSPHQPNWINLLKDLKAWNHTDRKIQRRWAKDYWT